MTTLLHGVVVCRGDQVTRFRAARSAVPNAPAAVLKVVAVRVAAVKMPQVTRQYYN